MFASYPAWEKLGADAILRRQLLSERWLNEHLQPSWWRLCGADADGNFVPLDRVGRLEVQTLPRAVSASLARLPPFAPLPWTSAQEFEEDWKSIIERLPHIDAEARAFYMRPLPPANTRSASPASKLSAEGQRLFCRSGLYGEEYAFLRRLGVSYEPPAACADVGGEIASQFNLDPPTPPPQPSPPTPPPPSPPTRPSEPELLPPLSPAGAPWATESNSLFQVVVLSTILAAVATVVAASLVATRRAFLGHRNSSPTRAAFSGASVRRGGKRADGSGVRATRGLYIAAPSSIGSAQHCSQGESRGGR